MLVKSIAQFTLPHAALCSATCSASKRHVHLKAIVNAVLTGLIPESSSHCFYDSEIRMSDQ